MCQESIKGTVSHNDLAAKLSCETKCDASRQAYFYRTKEETVEFFKNILALVMKNKYRLDIEAVQFNVKFKRILIQDSTIIRLPGKLYELFSGVNNGKATVCNARIQGIYDLLSGQFISFSIDSYSKNDLKAAPDIEVKEGDLVLRDRGYFILSCIEEMKRNGADSIMRYKHKTFFYDPESLKVINLLEKLQTFGTIDIEVLSDPTNKTRLRIIAAPVPEEVANVRRMKAKIEAKDRDCSQELLQLMGWTIFITTIHAPNFTIKEVCVLYSLRWRIECIFKTWKSNFNFDKIHNVSQIQLRVLLYARFITITALYKCLFVSLEDQVYLKVKKHLSLMKFMRFISRNLTTFIDQYFDENKKESAIQKLIRYCTFDERKRENFNHVINLVNLLNEKLT
jgi:hypothetical protein